MIYYWYSGNKLQAANQDHNEDLVISPCVH